MSVHLLNQPGESVRILDVNGSRMIARYSAILGGEMIVSAVSDLALSEDDREDFEAWAKSEWTTPTVPSLHFEYRLGHR
jgi:hypothetical protein